MVYLPLWKMMEWVTAGMMTFRSQLNGNSKTKIQTTNQVLWYSHIYDNLILNVFWYSIFMHHLQDPTSTKTTSVRGVRYWHIENWTYWIILIYAYIVFNRIHLLQPTKRSLACSSSGRHASPRRHQFLWHRWADRSCLSSGVWTEPMMCIDPDGTTN